MYSNRNTKEHYISPRRLQRSKRRKQQWLMAALISTIFCIVSGITLAYVFMNTDALKNEFKPSKVSCEVLEGEDGKTFDGVTKSDVRIKNTGDVQSYIRAKVVVTWMSEDQSKVTAIKPEVGSDYEIIYSKSVDESSNWDLGKDGYWYYKLPVNVGKETEELIESCSLIDGVTEPDGYYLSVEIVASAIQSTPESVVKEQWKSGVDNVVNGDDSNGNTVKIIVVKQGG